MMSWRQVSAVLSVVCLAMIGSNGCARNFVPQCAATASGCPRTLKPEQVEKGLASLHDYRPLILERAVAASRESEPEWRFIPAIVNAPPPMDGQMGVAAGTWERLSDPSTLVGATVSGMTTVEAATRRLERQAHGSMANGRTVVTYEARDGGTMSTYPDSRGFTQYEATIRKDRFLVTVSGRSQETVERFAKIVLTATRTWTGGA